ncbi:hypothetical protein F511_24677 [Dorcoceras hygrometricum]|uniref:Uncharacterized protein n=1 Tax=Dorcoceras hygrometricum TaxID=472368 RepID=A0A2Z7DAY9_9LAMI|nr:hypothetical protein F511_24677 [Dorcoceras hygrometricum]
MDWVHTKRRGPEWKQGWTDQTLACISAPPLPLLAVLAIVIFLLSLSQYSTYKEHVQNSVTSFKLLLFLVPVILIVFMRSRLLSGGGFDLSKSRPGREVRREFARGMAGFPWGIAVLVVVLLVLVSYQSSFESKWFPFGGSD